MESAVSERAGLEQEKIRWMEENQRLQEQLAKHLEDINELSLNNTVCVCVHVCVCLYESFIFHLQIFLSELEELKKSRGVVSSQARPTKPSDPNAGRLMPGVCGVNMYMYSACIIERINLVVHVASDLFANVSCPNTKLLYYCPCTY